MVMEMNYQEDNEDEKMKTNRWNLNRDHYDDDDILHFAPNMKTIKKI
jgi:hypothetical protein